MQSTAAGRELTKAPAVSARSMLACTDARATPSAPRTCCAPLRLLAAWPLAGLLSPTTLPICSAAVHAAFRPSPGSAQHGPHQHADASTAGSF